MRPLSDVRGRAIALFMPDTGCRILAGKSGKTGPFFCDFFSAQQCHNFRKSLRWVYLRMHLTELREEWLAIPVSSWVIEYTHLLSPLLIEHRALIPTRLLCITGTKCPCSDSQAILSRSLQLSLDIAENTTMWKYFNEPPSS